MMAPSAASQALHAPCPPGLLLRPMVVEDIPQVLPIERTAHFTPWGEQAFVDALATGDVLPMVLCDNEVVGYGVLKILWHEAELLNLSVAPAWRRRGVGRYLIAHLLQAALRYQAPEVFLEVRESNVGAQTLYHRSGFEVIGRRKGYYATQDGREDALLMRWQEGRKHDDATA